MIIMVVIMLVMREQEDDYISGILLFESSPKVTLVFAINGHVFGLRVIILKCTPM